MSQNQPMPKASARFNWSVPGDADVEFVVALYSNGTVSLSAPAPYVGLVTSLEWSDENDAIVDSSGYWSARHVQDLRTRKHLLLKATNALRRELGLPPHPMTPDWPGAE